MQKVNLSVRKPHVNIGTIGHVHHGRRRRRRRITERRLRKRPAASPSRVHVEGGAPLRPRRLPRPRRLCEEHDHRCCPYGRRHPGGGRRPDAADPRAHPPRPARSGVPAIVVYLNKVDLVDDPELLELVELEVRELSSKYEYPATTYPSSRVRRGALEDKNKEIGEDFIRGSHEGGRRRPTPDRPIDKPFLMPTSTVFSMRHAGGDRPRRARRGQGRRGA